MTIENAFERSYSFKSLSGIACDAIFTTTLATIGQISFYYSFTGSYSFSFDFYIDNVKITNYPKDGSGWRQAVANVDAGTHIFKWHLNPYISDSKCYIDQIIITK